MKLASRVACRPSSGLAGCWYCYHMSKRKTKSDGVLRLFKHIVASLFPHHLHTYAHMYIVEVVVATAMAAKATLTTWVSVSPLLAAMDNVTLIMKFQWSEASRRLPGNLFQFINIHKTPPFAGTVAFGMSIAMWCSRNPTCPTKTIATRARSQK